MSERLHRRTIVLAAFGALLFSNACAIGPKYLRPELPTPPAFKETPPAGWTDAQPSDDVPRGAWWKAYNDATLDALEARVSISNQNVLAAEAQFRAARAAVRVTRSGQFPAVTTTPSGARSGTGGYSGIRQYELPIDVSYEADVWGSIRRSVTANAALAQATAADLENARLLYEAELASDYFQLQGIDAERRLIDGTVQSYGQYLQLTQDRLQGGVVSMGDVAQAQTQFDTARAQLIDLGIPRAQFEHAIAVLIGESPADLALTPETTQTLPPNVAIGLPSSLLQRRPDIAAAERRVAAANAQIGVAKSALFPALSISAAGGSQASAIVDLFTLPTRFWSVGAQLAGTLFDGGKRRAQIKLTEASYDATVANYRQAVLTGFQQVEDGLAESRILSQEAEELDRAVAAAQQSLDISTTQYRGGLTNSLQVITAQTSLLQNQRAAVDVHTRRLTASVSLIQAIGGGWDISQLPRTD